MCYLSKEDYLLIFTLLIFQCFISVPVCGEASIKPMKVSNPQLLITRPPITIADYGSI